MTGRSSDGERATHRSRRRLLRGPGAILAVAVAVVGLGSVASSASALSDTTAVALPGSPMTVYVGPRGQCQSSYTVNGKVQGNFYPGGEPFEFSPVGDCGFFLAFPKSGTGQPEALQGKTFGFSGHAGPSTLTEFTPIAQSPVSGDGSTASPLSQTTTFEVVDSAAAKDALVTETTTYVNGQPQFTSTYNVKNLTANKLYFRALYAGDLFVNGSDQGVGVFLGGPPRFIGGQNTGSGILGGLQEVGTPALGWSAFEELNYPEVWTRVTNTVEEAKAFKEGVDTTEVDNAAGVEWDQLRTAGLAAGAEQSFSIINRTQVPSGLNVQPVTQSHPVGQTATVSVTAVDTAGTPYAGRPLVYSIGGANPKTGSVTTDGAGVATISYVGTAAGLDTLQMFLDLNANGSADTAEPSSAAQVVWTPLPPAPSPNSSYKIGAIHANSDGTITITFVPTQDGTAVMEVTVPTGTISRKEAEAAKKKKCKKNQIKIHGKCKPKNTLSGKITAKGRAGVALKLTVKPSSKVKKALKKGKKVSLTAKLTYKSVLGGKPTVQTFHLTVKPKKSKKKKH
jgi:hypothetical protein